MSLNRNDSCRHFMNGEVFVKCLCYYSAEYAGKSALWEIIVAAEDMPEGQQASPTDSQVNAVADAKAVTTYDSWTAFIDAETITEESHTGIGGVVSS